MKPADDLETSIFTEQHRMTLIEKDVHITLMELCSKYPNNKELMSEATELLALLSTDGLYIEVYSCEPDYIFCSTLFMTRNNVDCTSL